MHAEIPTRRHECVRVTLETYGGYWRVDIRHYFDPEEGRPGVQPGMQPTRKGVNLAASAIPQLRRALQFAEADALNRGILVADDYDAAGIEPPARLGGGR